MVTDVNRYCDEQSNNLFVFEIPQADLSIPNDQAYEIFLNFKKIDQESNIKKDVTFFRPMKFRKKSSAKEIHLKLFDYFRFLYENCPHIPNMNQKTNYEVIKCISQLKEGNYKIYIVPFDENVDPSFFPVDCDLYIDDIVDNIFNGEISFAFQVVFQTLPKWLNYQKLNTCIRFQDKEVQAELQNLIEKDLSVEKMFETIHSLIKPFKQIHQSLNKLAEQWKSYYKHYKSEEMQMEFNQKAII